MANEREEEEMKHGSSSPSDGLSSIERAFEGQRVPSWSEQLTVRAVVISFLIGIVFSVIMMKLNLTTGLTPSLNIAASLLGYFFVRSWTTVVYKLGLLRQPFTRQENTVIQTCVVAIYGIAISGGFGTYLFGMSDTVAKLVPTFNDPADIKVPRLGWMIGFLFIVSFVGLLSLVPLRKIMIIDYKLTYPSGTATAQLINSFHTPQGATFAKRQVKVLGKFFTFSFLWGFFQWFYTASDGCGFINFPTFGLKAYKNSFYFSFSSTYVGVGMICPYIVNVSLLLGGIFSWGLMWPLIESKKGDWYSADLPSSSFQGLYGYKVFLAISIVLGDGLYNFLKTIIRIIYGFVQQIRSKRNALPVTGDERDSCCSSVVESFDERRRKEYFLKDGIPTHVAVAGYVVLALISMGTLPRIFPPLKWYYILPIYVIAPVLAFCNAYGCGLTDISVAATYGVMVIFAVGAWAGESNGGVLAGLAACAASTNIVSTASDLMQDFKTGYLTLASPRSMFASQVIGTAIGCIISPCVFWIFYKAFPDLGQPNSEYPAPFALAFRNMAIVGVEGFDALPAHCLELCYAFFAAALFISFLRDVVPTKVSKYMPIPMAVAIPFYVGSYLAIDMMMGSVILFVWGFINKAQRDELAPAVASGLISGDGMWAVPQSLLALAKFKSPICMKFLSRADNARVDSFLSPTS